MKKISFLLFLLCTLPVLSEPLPVQIARETLQAYFLCPALNPVVFSQRWQTLSLNNGPVFITLSTNGKTRACWGALQPQSGNLIKSIIYATLDALNKDYAHSPIKREELENLKIQVTVIQSLIPVKSFRQINPVTDGLMVRSGSRSGVILPGEAKDSYYALLQACLKASLQKNDSYQIYRIKANVYR